MNTRINHICCFNQDPPACGNKEHKTCCLCGGEGEDFNSDLEDIANKLTQGE